MLASDVASDSLWCLVPWAPVFWARSSNIVPSVSSISCCCYDLLSFLSSSPSDLISVPVVVCLKKVQIGPKRCKKSLTNVIAKHCSGIRESDFSTIYSICITVFGPRYRLLRVLDFKHNVNFLYTIYQCKASLHLQWRYRSKVLSLWSLPNQ